MPLFKFRRPHRADFSRTSRELRPAVIAFEPRLLMSKRNGERPCY